MSSESDLLRLRDPDVLANRFGVRGAEEPRRLPIRVDAAPGLARALRCVTPAHIVVFALVLALLLLAERLTHPLHLS